MDHGIIGNADIVFIRFVVMHQTDPVGFLHNIVTKMKPNAMLLIFEPYSSIDAYSDMQPTELANALTKRLEFKLKLGELEDRCPNCAPRIPDTLGDLNMRDIKQSIIEVNYLQLEDTRDLFLKNFEIMKDRIVSNSLDTVENIDSYINVIKNADSTIITYLGTAYIICAYRKD